MKKKFLLSFFGLVGVIIITPTVLASTSTDLNLSTGYSVGSPSTARYDGSSQDVTLLKYVKTYTKTSVPAIADNSIFSSFLDASSSFLYVSTYSDGLSVINTKTNTLVKNYSKTSSPAIISNYIMSSFFDASSSLLYVSTQDGLSVINTKTDTLVKNYTTATTPAIVNNNVQSSFLDASSSLLYVNTWNGLSVINTKTDTLAKTYTSATNPAIINRYVNNSFLDASSSLLYVSTQGGVSVINTNTNTLVKTYTTATTPAIVNNEVKSSFLDTSSGYLYVSTWGGGLSVINTKTNTLVKNYTTTSTPAIADNNVLSSFFASSSSLLYVSTVLGGLNVINTETNTLVKNYTNTSSLSIGDSYVHSSFLDASSSLLYVNTGWAGVIVIDAKTEAAGTTQYFPSGSFNTLPISISSSTPFSNISINNTGSGEVSVQSRTGDSNAVWHADFADLVANSKIVDLFDYGAPYNAITESGGILTLADPTIDVANYIWIDTGYTEESPVPAGSTISIQVRSHGTASAFWLYTGDYDNDYGVTALSDNEWKTMTFAIDKPITNMGFEVDYPSEALSSDSLDIRNFIITFPDSAWGSWSDACSSSHCPFTVPSNSAWFQTRLNLTTPDTNVTPIISSVTLNEPVAETPTPTPTSTPPTPVHSSGGFSPAARAAYLATIQTPNITNLPIIPTVSAPVTPSTTPPVTSSSSFTPILINSHDLKFGQTDTSILALQQFLNSYGFIVAKTGAGSPHHETNYFGSATHTALIKFQKAHGITPASGYFGPITRKYILNNY